jgi:hypothetical protein
MLWTESRSPMYFLATLVEKLSILPYSKMLYHMAGKAEMSLKNARFYFWIGFEASHFTW